MKGIQPMLDGLFFIRFIEGLNNFSKVVDDGNGNQLLIWIKKVILGAKSKLIGH
jgi:hypothetical protein